MIGCLVGWLVGWLVGNYVWLVGWLVNSWLVCSLVIVFGWLKVTAEELLEQCRGESGGLSYFRGQVGGWYMICEFLGFIDGALEVTCILHVHV